MATRAQKTKVGIFLVACFVVLAGGFTLQWLGEILPALGSGQPPPSVQAAGLLVNAVHVLDLALLLPGMAAAAVLLWRGKALGYVLAPVMLGFTLLMALAIAAMAVVMGQRGFGNPAVLAVAFTAIAGAAGYGLVSLSR